MRNLRTLNIALMYIQNIFFFLKILSYSSFIDPPQKNSLFDCGTRARLSIAERNATMFLLGYDPPCARNKVESIALHLEKPLIALFSASSRINTRSITRDVN